MCRPEFIFNVLSQRIFHYWSFCYSNTTFITIATKLGMHTVHWTLLTLISNDKIQFFGMHCFIYWRLDNWRMEMKNDSQSQIKWNWTEVSLESLSFSCFFFSFFIFVQLLSFIETIWRYVSTCHISYFCRIIVPFEQKMRPRTYKQFLLFLKLICKGEVLFPSPLGSIGPNRLPKNNATNFPCSNRTHSETERKGKKKTK